MVLIIVYSFPTFDTHSTNVPNVALAQYLLQIASSYRLVDLGFAISFTLLFKLLSLGSLFAWYTLIQKRTHSKLLPVFCFPAASSLWYCLHHKLLVKLLSSPIIDSFCPVPFTRLVVSRSHLLWIQFPKTD